MSDVSSVLARLDSLVEKKVEIEALAQELFEEQVTPYNIITELTDVKAEIEESKALLRNMFETENIYETKKYSLANAKIDVRYALGIDVNSLVAETPILKDPALSKYITEETKYKLSKTTDKNTFIEMLESKGYDASAFKVPKYSVHVKEVKKNGNGKKR